MTILIQLQQGKSEASKFNKLINQHPLACYVFSKSITVQHELISRIQFGGGSINHCIQQPLLKKLSENQPGREWATNRIVGALDFSERQLTSIEFLFDN